MANAMMTISELGDLMTRDGAPALSIYMPAHRTTDEQDSIRLKNLLRDAEARLISSGVRSPEARRITRPAQALLTDMTFWQHQSDGLAVFASPNVFTSYRLPYKFADMVHVGERFHIKPLLPLFSSTCLFYVLALSQNRVRLLQCSRYGACDITPASLPASLKDALKYEDINKRPQMSNIGSGVPFGYSDVMSYNRENILRYFHAIDHGLREELRGELSPLVLAGVGYLHPLYRQANTYGYLLEQGIEGNPEQWSADELQRRAWAILEPIYDQDQRKAIDRYREATNKGKAADDIRQALLAAHDGRVDTLLVALDVQRWGNFDASSREVKVYPELRSGSEDLLDLAAVKVLTQKGAVYALEKERIPFGAEIAAVMRY